MRWFIGVAVAIVVLILIYLGSAASSLSKLVAAARAGDGAAVIELTDVPALSRSLTNQIVAAYLERIGATRRIGPMEKMLINTYGATIADAMVAKMLTADKLTQILKTGNLNGASDAPNIAGLPALADLHAENWASLLGRLRFVQPVLLAIRVSKTSDPDSYAAVNLHYQDFGWKLSGIVLPKAAVRELAASLPVK
jgi:CTP:molybdopterin cytidylyltransferase MocA